MIRNEKEVEDFRLKIEVARLGGDLRAWRATASLPYEFNTEVSAVGADLEDVLSDLGLQCNRLLTAWIERQRAREVVAREAEAFGLPGVVDGPGVIKTFRDLAVDVEKGVKA